MGKAVHLCSADDALEVSKQVQTENSGQDIECQNVVADKHMPNSDLLPNTFRSS
jgi:hypothetical protein